MWRTNKWFHAVAIAERNMMTDDAQTDVTTSETYTTFMAHTWEDVRRAAVHDVVLQRTMHYIDTGFPREPCLIWAVLALAKINQSLVDDVKALMANRPAAPIILVDAQ